MNKILSHLQNDYIYPIRDPLWGNINLSGGFKQLITSESFQRLGRIKQLGPSFHVYPGAVHTRLNHSLGVFHLSKQIIQSLLIKRSPEFISEEGVKTFLCAALFHDIGHFPFAHSLKDLDIKDHEQLSAEIILSEPLYSLIKDSVGIDPYYAAGIIDTKLDIKGNMEVLLYRKILSGVLDPDKLDYLNRDAYFCGVPYGIQDSEFIIKKLLVWNKTIAIENSGLIAVENLLFSKYLMYKAVYWHKTVRIATAMIKKAIFMGLKEGIIAPSDLYHIDDEQFFHILSKKENFGPFSLITRVLNRNFYKSALELPFDPHNKKHIQLQNLEKRYEVSRKIAGEKVNPELVIIDIPESVSFEVDLPIISGERELNMEDAGSVFSPSVVKNFTSGLRKIRILVPGELKETAERIGKAIL